MKGYDKFNYKYMAVTIAIMLVGLIGVITTMINVNDDIDFYRNSKYVKGFINNISVSEDDQKINYISVIYEVKGKEYTAKIKLDESDDIDYYKVNDNIRLFYDETNPKDCRMDSRSAISIYLVVFILSMIGAYGAYLTGSHIKKIILNRKLIKDNNFIMADFYKIKKRKSYYNNINGIENYVKCRYRENENDEYIYFTSMFMKNDIGHYLKDKKIKVYVDKNNYKIYLVDMNDINEKVKTVTNND
ncbi:MAG: hypothetical protein K6G26_07305 [Lachnospiraceae bacterium]|nr:hypothetical protein [Lachnospiraceae bacterium]